jgi:hypothetical protein
MENQLLPISQSKMQEPSGSDTLIREWLFRFGVEHKEDVAPRLPLWLEAFGAMDATIEERLYSRALKTCRFFPKVAEILEPIQKAEETATPQAAEMAWERVLELRRVYWNPDMPGGFSRGMPKLSERVQSAARAAGVFREVSNPDQLHVWGKKIFIESFIAYGELEQDRFLLPDGEMKNLLAGLAETKALPPASVEWSELRARGLEYGKTLNAPSERLDTVHVMPIREIARVVEVDGRRAELQRQAEMIREKYPKPGNTAGNPPELPPVEEPA